MTVTDATKRDAWQEESDLPLILVTINHPDLVVPIRAVNNNENIVSNGQEYVALPFEPELPDANEDSPPRGRLRIDNVSREIGQAIRQIQSPASVTLEVVRQSDPNVVEISFPEMRLSNTRVTALTVIGDLEFEDLVREPFPAHSFVPSAFPALF